ncbi:MAG: TonB-dependent receptor [Proteobacteria bacterium]|nr:TonB-dependent receptor [Pseudomonadota bacterium]
MTDSILSRAVRRAIYRGAVPALTLAMLVGAPAMAADEEVQEVTVTGTRIRQVTGMTTPVPVTSVVAADLKLSNPGAALADQLDKLPQLFQTESAQRGSGALFGNAGGSYVNLRGLGSQRTLVLLDGARIVPDDRGGTVNIGVLPQGLIKNVDIITGGASAQYGADAVGGVVNFVLDRKFQGLKASASTGITERGDGFNNKVSVTGGTRIGDKLNLTASVDMNNIDQISRDPLRLGDWFQHWGYIANPAYKSATLTPGVPVRLTAPNLSQPTFSPFGRIDNAYNAAGVTVPTFSFINTAFTQDGTGTRPFIQTPGFSTAIGTMQGGPEYDYHNQAHRAGPFGAQVKERSAFLGGEYEINDRVQVYGHVLYGSSESNSVNQRGNPELEDPYFATIFSGNPYLPTAVQTEMTAKSVASIKVNKLGQFLNMANYNQTETAHNVHTMFTWSAGVKADISDNWQVNASWQSGRSHKYTGVFGEVRLDRLFLAIDAVKDSTGKIICNVQLPQYNPSAAQIAAATQAAYPGKRDKYGELLQSPIGLDGSVSGCVPINIFGQGNVSAAANAYVTGDKWGISDVHQHFGEVLFTGKVLEGWAGSINAAAGANYRAEDINQQAYPIDLDHNGPPLNLPTIGIRGVPSGYATGSPNIFAFSTVPPMKGDYNVKEIFGELDIPLLKLSSGQRVGLNLALRNSQYSETGSVNSYKAGLDFQVFDDLRVRGTLSRDVREPTFSERFDSQGSGGNINPDPVVAACRYLTGKDVCAYTVTPVTTGNPSLKPEQADTVTFGAIYRPRWIEGLQMSVDYYDIQVKDAIGTLGYQRIVTDCFNGETSLCQYVERDPVTKVIGRVLDTYQNIANTAVRGIDYEVQYTAHPDLLTSLPETLTIRGFGSRLLERSNQASSTGLVNNFASGFTGGTLYPDWKGNLSLTYTIDKWSVQVNEEYISRAKINTTYIDQADWDAGRTMVNGVAKTAPDVDVNWLPNYFNTNLRVGYSSETDKGHVWDVSFFVTNLLDKHPMIFPSNNSRGSSQTVSNNYDAYGRRYVLGMNYKF